MPIISKLIGSLFQKNYFGFLSISNVLEPKIIEDMRALVYKGSDKIISEFEELFSKKIELVRIASLKTTTKSY